MAHHGGAVTGLAPRSHACRRAGRGWRIGLRGLAAVVCAWVVAAPLAAQPALRELPQPMPREEALRIDVLQGTLLRVAQSGTVRLAYRADALPFSFVPEGRSTPVGYTIDICRAVVDTLSRRLGRSLEIQWVPVTAQDRFAVVANGRADLECSVSSDTPQRRDLVAFSDPIFVTGARLLVRRDDTLRRMTDLAGKRVGVVAGTSAEAAVGTVLAQLHVQAEIVPQPGYGQGLAAVAEGRIDALLADEVLLHGLLANHPMRQALRMQGPWVTHEAYGLAYARNDTQMDAVVVETLWRMADNRELENDYARWFQGRLPDGTRLGLPMRPAMRALIDITAEQAQRRR